MDQDFNLKINLLWNFDFSCCIKKKRSIDRAKNRGHFEMSKKYERYAKFNGIHLCHTFQEVTRYLHVGFLLVTMKVERKKSKLI